MVASVLLRFRVVLGFFVFGLLISGITAFPLLAEMRWLAQGLGVAEAGSPDGYEGITYWVLAVKCGLEDVYGQYPWMAYGTDWLAFAHIIIALFFIGPLVKPWEARPAIYAGIAACILVIPLALIGGGVRGIPMGWRLIDCSFGVLGAMPLWYCLSKLKQIEAWIASSTGRRHG